MAFDEDTTEEHERRIVRCREAGCRARIIFMLNEATGKRVPVDADTVGPSDDQYDPSRHVSHFKTCTAPNRFSKGRRSP
jgi:hypothetical protein